ncbi:MULTISPECIES: HD family phosphohydrolase [unclassified Lentimicrobium]|uniref:HD family phosphohydrolase n=1 Tax=unclassified Lentimicrobium TaxID=2677434 RepID=UPI0015565136|nr:MULTISPECIES: HDIG domain-containing metalloprotein [unclassified Lentimicrobium]NPD44749.1 HDIG domain-containing protein [Lentimicrobium sp. S6]NPD83395.1 HDIG domain-containing protein [Lentimicrobium sp. L6]
MKKLIYFLRYRYTIIYKVILFLAAMIIMVYFFPKTARFSYDYSQGYPWTSQSLIAPFDFAVLKTPQEVEKEKELLLMEVIPYYRYDEKIGDSLKPIIQKEFEMKWAEHYGAAEKLAKKKRTWEFIHQKFSLLVQKGVRSSVINRNSNGHVSLLKGNQATVIPLSSIYTLSTAQYMLEQELINGGNIDQTIAKEIIAAHLFQNVSYDELMTTKEEEALLSNLSLSYGLIQKGELIIAEGELVTTEKYQILESLRAEFVKQVGGSKEYIWTTIGLGILIIIVFLSLAIYLNLFRPSILRHSSQILLILVSMMLFVIPESLLIQNYPDYILLLPLPLLAIIIRSFFDVRTAMFVYLLTVIIISSFIPDGYNFIFLQLITGIITIVSIHRLNKRRQFYLTSLWIFLSYSFIYVALLLVRDGSLNHIEIDTFYLLAISAALSLFSYPIIYLFEKLFGQITALTLLELSDTNNKLLRDLAHKAPGTFQHSLQVGNLCEAALIEVGGNALLVRAGALYHDIGKMYNPMYFIENQTTQVNPHDELSYEESAEIIISHVKYGVKLAKKHRLPEMIIDFIRTHHGNRKAEYFYRMAVKEEGVEEVDESIYTYPGPIPFSKETAVLMMADSIEAASRSIPKPDENILSNLVDQIITGQMQSGQFDNADITLKEINQIKKIFKKMLLTIYHIRIEYPD